MAALGTLVPMLWLGLAGSGEASADTYPIDYEFTVRINRTEAFKANINRTEATTVRINRTIEFDPQLS